ncbi:MAG TPA: ABC transporter ATP-binding protein [Crenotrichaceae bacterium]|nr:ABC transporter ATP-binding protein [Crenotrichaceae bacterium]
MTEHNAALLKINNLKTWFASQRDDDKRIIKAVDGIDLAINRGETFCLVGESGSGKSITALSIMGLLPTDVTSHPDGEILFYPKHQQSPVDLLTLADAQMRDIRGSQIAMIFQEPMNSLNPVFSIGEQIIEALLLHHPELSYEAARLKAIQALTDVQIPNPEQRIDNFPHQLSGGQRQRVMIAMAIACEPELLIADEPTTALDVTVQKEVLLLMQELQQRRNMGILFITHDFGVVSEIGDQLAVMHQGKLVETGQVNSVLFNPQQAYTKKLIASLPHNLKQHKQPLQKVNTSMNTPLIQLNNLKVWFPIKKGLLKHTIGYIKAVDDVDLDIPHGQILALVGESGCGKTTLGRSILRLTEPTDGTILINGTDVSTLDRREFRAYRKTLQIIFQDPMSSLNPRLTIATTLTEPMAVHGIGESHQQRLQLAEQLLEQVQLSPDYLWRYPHQFSGGQRQRIGIARALALNPDFIVCDEVTSALDVSVQAEILQLLLELRKQRGLTLLFITHNIGVVEYISDMTAVMYQGKIVEQGVTEQVCGNPKHPYTQKLLSAVPRIAA